MDENEKPPVHSPQPEKRSSKKDTYNIVTDTITGPNVRFHDNIVQAVVIAIFLVIGAIVGAVGVEDDWLWGAMVGGAVGMFVGLIGSGVWLMVYRGMRHIRGQHD